MQLSDLTFKVGEPITFSASVSGRHERHLQLVSFGRVPSPAVRARHPSRLTPPDSVVRRLPQLSSSVDSILPARETASCSDVEFRPEQPVTCRKFDEYSDLRFNDEKARLDNLAIQLQQDPTAQAYYVVFGSCDTEGAARSTRAVDYLVNNRGIDRARITVVDGGCRETLTVELWICPTGAGAPIRNKLRNCRSLARPAR